MMNKLLTIIAVCILTLTLLGITVSAEDFVESFDTDTSSNWFGREGVTSNQVSVTEGKLLYTSGSGKNANQVWRRFGSSGFTGRVVFEMEIEFPSKNQTTTIALFNSETNTIEDTPSGNDRKIVALQFMNTGVIKSHDTNSTYKDFSTLPTYNLGGAYYLKLDVDINAQKYDVYFGTTKENAAKLNDQPMDTLNKTLSPYDIGRLQIYTGTTGISYYLDNIKVSNPPAPPEGIEVVNDLNYTFANSGSGTATSLTEGGSVTGTLKIKNNYAAGSKPLTLITALFSPTSNKHLVSLNFDSHSVAAGTEKVFTSTISDLPEGDLTGYYVKAFFWNGFDALTPVDGIELDGYTEPEAVPAQ